MRRGRFSTRAKGDKRGHGLLSLLPLLFLRREHGGQVLRLGIARRSFGRWRDLDADSVRQLSAPSGKLMGRRSHLELGGLALAEVFDDGPTATPIGMRRGRGRRAARLEDDVGDVGLGVAVPRLLRRSPLGDDGRRAGNDDMIIGIFCSTRTDSAKGFAQE